jgi:hypothetical protein
MEIDCVFFLFSKSLEIPGQWASLPRWRRRRGSIPSFLPFSVGPGENPIPLRMGGIYASGMVSFFKASL